MLLVISIRKPNDSDIEITSIYKHMHTHMHACMYVCIHAHARTKKSEGKLLQTLDQLFNDTCVKLFVIPLIYPSRCLSVFCVIHSK